MLSNANNSVSWKQSDVVQMTITDEPWNRSVLPRTTLVALEKVQRSCLNEAQSWANLEFIAIQTNGMETCQKNNWRYTDETVVIITDKCSYYYYHHYYYYI